MNRKYSNPPIAEVFCEFRFIPSKPWDSNIPEILYKKIKKDFPERQQKTTFDIRFESKNGGIEHKAIMVPRMLFGRSDKTAVIQIAADLLLINHLKPYPTWEGFKPLIFNNLEKYKEIAKPKGLNRIGLRYINKIDFNNSNIELKDYFNISPLIPKKLQHSHRSFSSNIEIPYENERDLLRLILSSKILKNQNILSVTFDLDYFMMKPEGIVLENVNVWADNAHTMIENAFESCITDKCRSLFMEKKK
jgi:uncharacterized protein (TIGR04255 family)